MKKAPNKSRRRLQNGSQWKWRQQQPADRQTDTTTETNTHAHTHSPTEKYENTVISLAYGVVGVLRRSAIRSETKKAHADEWTNEWVRRRRRCRGYRRWWWWSWVVGGFCAAGGGGSWKYGAHFDGEKETEETGIAIYSHLRVVWKGVEGGVRQSTDQPTPVQMAHVSLALALDATTTTQQNMKIQKQQRPRDTIKR